MVIKNICYLLNNFLQCSEYENIIFCWVMHDKKIIDDILNQLSLKDVSVYKFTLMIKKDALIKRIEKDISEKKRTIDSLERSLDRLSYYDIMNTVKIDVSDISPLQAANIIKDFITNKEK